MIVFRKKPPAVVSDPVKTETPTNSPEGSEEAAAARRKKADSDGAHRRARQTVQDNRLL
jgi:hypothetical protein